MERAPIKSACGELCRKVNFSYKAWDQILHFIYFFKFLMETENDILKLKKVS